MAELNKQDRARYLDAGEFVDSDHPDVIAFTMESRGDSEDPADMAVRLYYAVRDSVTYNPYRDYQSHETYRASSCLNEGQGFCVGKAALLSAVCRAAGVPARLGFADVRNHLASKKLIELLGGNDVFCWHGFSEIYLDGKWVKATPAFDLALCERFGTEPLEFDGSEDSIFQPFNSEDQKFMEYLKDRGSYADVPVQEMIEGFFSHYPNLMKKGVARAKGTFHDEAAGESGG